jgi:hypothetical protein
MEKKYEEMYGQISMRLLYSGGRRGRAEDLLKVRRVRVGEVLWGWGTLLLYNPGRGGRR